MFLAHKQFWRLGAALCAMILITGACTTGQEEAEQPEGGGDDNGQLAADEFPSVGGKTIGYVPIGLGTPLTENWQHHLELGADRLGWEIVTRDPNWNAQEQPPAVQSLIDQGVDALVVHNTDVNVNAEVLKRAEEAGIWTVTVNMASTHLPSVHVGGEWGHGGELQAKEVVKACDGEGKVAVITGDATSQATLDLIAGGEKVFDKHPGLEVVSTQTGNWDRTRARNIASTQLTQHPDLCAIWGFWDQMTVGAAEAVRAAGKRDQVSIITMDSTIGCEAVKDRRIDVTFSFHVPRQGDQIVDALDMLFQMEEQGVEPGDFHTAIWSEWDKVTPQNVDEPGLCYESDT